MREATGSGTGALSPSDGSLKVLSFLRLDRDSFTPYSNSRVLVTSSISSNSARLWGKEINVALQEGSECR